MVLYYCYLVVKKASVLIAMIAYHAKKMVETQITFTVVKHTVNQCNNLFIILLL